MKNLDQSRARHALKAAEDNVINGKKGGELVKKLPARITNNGLLAALSFSFEQLNKKSDDRKGPKEEALGHLRLFKVLADHLREQGHLTKPEVARTLERLKQVKAGTTEEVEAGAGLRVVLEELATMSALRLRLATAEAQAYLGFLRRYAQKEADEL